MMKHNDSSINNIFSAQPNQNITGVAQQQMQEHEEIRSKATETALWASAQGLALAKLKAFHTMAKAVNDQQ